MPFRFGLMISRTRGHKMKRTVLGSSVLIATLLAALFLTAPALSSEACPGLVARRHSLILPAALGSDDVRITFVGHATFLIESPGGMNKAHSTHFSYRPDSAIPHVLRGW